MTSEEKHSSTQELRIDRIEGNLAVVEDAFGHCFPIPVELLPPGARENDVLRISISIDEERTKALLQQSKNLIQEIKTRKPSL